MPEILDLLASVQLNERPAIAGLRAIEAQAKRTGAALSGVEKTAADFGKGRVASPLTPTRTPSSRTPRPIRLPGAPEMLGPKQLAGDPLMAQAKANIARMSAANAVYNKAAAQQTTASAKIQGKVLDRANRDEIKRLSPARVVASAVGGGLTSGGVFGGVVSGNLAADAILAVSRAALTGGAAVLWYSSKLEQTAVSFKTLLGSSAAATVHIKDLQQFAKTTPFEFAELTGASRRLQNVGFSAQEVIPLMRDIGNAASAAGASQEDLNGITLAMSQIAAKGKVSAEELNQLGERGIPGLKILSEQLGLSKAQVMKLGEAGQLSSELFFKAFSNYSQANFGGAMEAQSRTFQGALSNIKDALMISAANDFKPLYNAISGITVSIADGMNAAEPSLGRTFRTAGEELGRSMREGFDNIWKGQTPPKPGEKPYSPYVTEPKTAGEKIKANAQIAAGLAYSVAFGAGGVGALNVGSGLVEGPKQKSLADLRKGDDTNTNLPGRLPDVSKSADLLAEGQRLLNAKEGREKIKYEKELNLVYADQNLAIARANASRNNSLSTIKNLAAAEESAIQQQIGIVRNSASDAIMDLPKDLTAADVKSAMEKINRETTIETAKLETQLAVQRINAQEQIKQKLEEVAKAQREVGSLVAQTESARTGNSLVEMFDAAQVSISETYDKFKNIDVALARTASNAVRAQKAMEFGKLGFDAKMQAIDFSQQARLESLRRPEEMSGFGRRLDALGEVAEAAKASSDFRATARNTRYNARAGTGMVPLWQKQLEEQREDLDELDDYTRFTTRLSGLAKNFGNLGIEGKATLAAARFNALNPDELMRMRESGNAEVRMRARQQLEIRAANADVLALAEEKKISDAIARNQIINKTAIPFAEEKLNQIRANAALSLNDPRRQNDRALQDQFLSVTAELGGEITAPLLEERIKVLTSSAELENQYSSQLLTAAQNTVTNTANIASILLTGKKVQGGAEPPTGKQPNSPFFAPAVNWKVLNGVVAQVNKMNALNSQIAKLSIPGIVTARGVQTTKGAYVAPELLAQQRKISELVQQRNAIEFGAAAAEKFVPARPEIATPGSLEKAYAERSAEVRNRLQEINDAATVTKDGLTVLPEAGNLKDALKRATEVYSLIDEKAVLESFRSAISIKEIKAVVEKSDTQEFTEAVNKMVDAIKGSESFVTIKNEAPDNATVSTRPRASNTAKRYGK